MVEYLSEIQNRLDDVATRRLLAKYPRADDRYDWGLMGVAPFHPDAIDEDGECNGLFKGFIEYTRQRNRAGNHWMHVNGTQNIEIESDMAWTENCTHAFRRNPPLRRRGGVDESPINTQESSV